MTANDGSIAGVVLAAGTSSRMGGANKLLLEIDREPLVRRTVRRALEAELRPVVVVQGHQAELTRAAIVGLDHQAVLNREYRRGLTSSLRAGVAALPGTVCAAIMMLADMPRVTTAMLTVLVETYRARGACLVASDYSGVGAPPTLFDRSLFPEILALPDDRSPRSVVARHRERAEIVTWPAQRRLDLDRPENLTALGL